MSATQTNEELGNDTEQVAPSDLETVYKRVIQTSGNVVIPLLRPKTSINQRPQTSTSSKRSSDDFLPKSLDCSHLSASTEDIVIKQLPFHERECFDTSYSRRHSAVNKPFRDSVDTTLNKTPSSVYHNAGKNQLYYKNGSKAAEFWTSVYSEQSMRYVTEQVAVEQARQRKKLANVQQHRIDRRYLVNGSRFFVNNVYNVRTASAVTPRIHYSRRGLVRPRIQLLHRPQPKLDLTVSGTSQACIIFDQPRVRSGKISSEQKKTSQDNSRSSSVTVKTSGYQGTNGITNDNSKNHMRVASDSEGSQAGLNRVTNNYQILPVEKPVRSVTFTLPNENSFQSKT